MDYRPSPRRSLTGTKVDSSLENIPICVLDFDGVLHHDEVFYTPGIGVHMNAADHELFEWADILVELLESFSDVRIVLSTSWVRARGFEFAKAALPKSLRARVVDATFRNRAIQKAEFDFMSRGQQIVKYVERQGLRRWFAIDDDAAGWPECGDHRLIKTKAHLGLSEATVQRAIREILLSL